MKIRVITKRRVNKKFEYTVYFHDGTLLKIETTDDYQGSSVWGGYFGINDLTIEEAVEGKKILGAELIEWKDLPPIIQAHIEKCIYEKWGNSNCNKI